MNLWKIFFAIFVLFSPTITYSHSMEKIQNTYVLVHGMTGGGWDWKLIDNLLSQDGHEVSHDASIVIGMARPQPLAHPMRNGKEFGRVANIKRTLLGQRAVDHVSDPSWTRAHDNDLGRQIHRFRDRVRHESDSLFRPRPQLQ